MIYIYKINSLNNQKIYFICNGSSNNNIIDSINNEINKQNNKPISLKSFFKKKRK